MVVLHVISPALNSALLPHRKPLMEDRVGAPSARMELSYLFVLPLCIGHGHGRALIEHAKATSRALGGSVAGRERHPHAVAA